MNSIQRKVEKKDWSQLFVDRVEEFSAARIAEREASRATEADEIPEEFKHLKIAQKFIQDMAENRLYTEIRNQRNQFKCHTTLENLTPPKVHTNWNHSWGTQLLCEICGYPGISECVTCEKCDMIAHIQCIRFQLQDQGVNNVTNATIYSYNCPNCKESIIADQKYYQQLKEKLELERKQEYSSRKIMRRILILNEKKKLAKKKAAVICLQANARRLIMRNRHIAWKRTLIKLVIFDIKQLPPATVHKGVIVLTIVDPFKNSQSLRLDKTCEEALSEAFLIAGVSANMTICLTLAKEVDLHDGVKRYFAYGQTQLNLRDIKNFDKQRNFSLNFMDKIKWIPQEFKGEYRFHLMTSQQAFANAIMNSQTLLANAAAAAMSNPATTHTGTAAAVSATSSSVAAASAHAAALALAEAGFSSGPVSSTTQPSTPPPAVSTGHDSYSPMTPGSVAAAGSGLAAAQYIGRTSSICSLESDTYSIDSSTLASPGVRRTGSVRFGSIKSAGRAVITDASVSTAPSGDATQRTPLSAGRTCVVGYLPQNPVASMVTMVFAPPLDILKRSADIGFKATKGAGNGGVPTYRNSRYWLCFYRMRLLLYQYYGDASPRLISDVSEATVVINTDLKGRKIASVQLQHADQQRVWTIEFNNRHEAHRFAFAVNESRRGYLEGHSRFIKARELTIPDTPIQTIFGFSTAGIY